MVYVLGGYQSDFARNWAREGLSIGDGFVETVRAGLETTRRLRRLRGCPNTVLRFRHDLKQ